MSLKEQLEARRDALRAGIEKMKLDIIATDASVRECEHWIAELDKSEATQPDSFQTETAEAILDAAEFPPANP